MPDWVRTVEYSHDATVLAAGGNSFSHLFQSGTGEQLAEFDCTDGQWIQSLSFSLDDRILATAPDNRVKLWDIHTGTLLAELSGRREYITKVSFHPSISNLLLSVDECGHVCLWDIDSETPDRRAVFTAHGANGRACWLSRSSETTLLLGTRFGCVEEWSLHPSPKRLRIFTSDTHTASVSALASSHDGSLIASGSNDGIVVYNAETGSTHSSVAGMTTGMLLTLRFAPLNGSTVLAFGAVLGMGLFYTDRGGSHLIQLPGHSDFVRHIAFSPNSRFLASGSDDRTIKVWEAKLADLEAEVDDGHHAFLIRCAHFSRDGQFMVSASVDHTVRVWSAANGTLQQVLKGHPSWVYAATFLSDPKYIISRDDAGVMILWNWRRGEILLYDTEIYEKYRHFQRNFPFMHGPLGFFSTNETNGTCNFWCWLVERDSADNVQLRLMAQGSLPSTSEQEYVVRIYHENSSDNKSITLVAECASGSRYLTPWTNYDTVIDPPEALLFAKDTEKQGEPVNPIDRPSFIGMERVARRSEEKAWILDDRGRKILWVPQVHRGFGRWHEKKLLLQGESGRLTLIDFSQVDMDDDQPF